MVTDPSLGEGQECPMIEPALPAVSVEPDTSGDERFGDWLQA
jgi:hypothetical protein